MRRGERQIAYDISELSGDDRIGAGLSEARVVVGVCGKVVGSAVARIRMYVIAQAHWSLLPG